MIHDLRLLVNDIIDISSSFANQLYHHKHHVVPRWKFKRRQGESLTLNFPSLTFDIHKDS